LTETDLRLPDIGPGDTMDVFYVYITQASTGFGETGVLAAIGDLSISARAAAASKSRWDPQPLSPGRLRWQCSASVSWPWPSTRAADGGR
jgi:hypothetical protein